MNLKKASLFAVVAAYAATMSVGCSGQSNIAVQDAPAVVAPPPKPVPADVKKGGGKGSSGNMGINPGASS